MSPHASELLLNIILPVLARRVPQRVHPAAGEDVEELVQDAVAVAANMLEADEQAGRQSIPVSITYYAIQRLKSGRRSYSSSTTDVLSPRAQYVNGLSVVSTEAPVGDADDDLCLGDLLACRRDDPATAASRDLDWAAVMVELDDRKRGIVHDIAVGHSMKSMAGGLKISAPRVTQIKDEIGKEIRFRMGDQVLADAAAQPLWRHSLRARQAGRPDRNIPSHPRSMKIAA